MAKLIDTVPIPIKESIEEPSAKVSCIFKYTELVSYIILIVCCAITYHPYCVIMHHSYIIGQTTILILSKWLASW